MWTQRVTTFAQQKNINYSLVYQSLESCPWKNLGPTTNDKNMTKQIIIQSKTRNKQQVEFEIKNK